MSERDAHNRRGIALLAAITLGSALIAWLLITCLGGCAFYKGIDSGTRTYGTTNDPYRY